MTVLCRYAVVLLVIAAVGISTAGLHSVSDLKPMPSPAKAPTPATGPAAAAINEVTGEVSPPEPINEDVEGSRAQPAGELIATVLLQRHTERFPKLQRKKVKKNFQTLWNALTKPGDELSAEEQQLLAAIRKNFYLGGIYDGSNAEMVAECGGTAGGEAILTCIDAVSNTVTSAGLKTSRDWGRTLRREYYPTARISHVEATCTSRTIQTAETFLAGWGAPAGTEITRGPEEDYDVCLKDGDFDTERGKHQKALTEKNMIGFGKSSIMGLDAEKLSDLSSSHLVDMIRLVSDEDLEGQTWTPVEGVLVALSNILVLHAAKTHDGSWPGNDALMAADDQKYKRKYAGLPSGALNAGSFLECRALPFFSQAVKDRDEGGTAQPLAVYFSHESLVLSLLSLLSVANPSFNPAVPEFQGTVALELRYAPGGGKQVFVRYWESPQGSFRVIENTMGLSWDSFVTLVQKVKASTPEFPRVPKPEAPEEWAVLSDPGYCRAVADMAAAHQCVAPE